MPTQKANANERGPVRPLRDVAHEKDCSSICIFALTLSGLELSVSFGPTCTSKRGVHSVRLARFNRSMGIEISVDHFETDIPCGVAKKLLK